MNPAWPEATCTDDDWATALIIFYGQLKEEEATVRGSALIRRLCALFTERFPATEKQVADWTLTDMHLTAIRGLLEIIERELAWEAEARQSNN